MLFASGLLTSAQDIPGHIHHSQGGSVPYGCSVPYATTHCCGNSSTCDHAVVIGWEQYLGKKEDCWTASGIACFYDEESYPTIQFGDISWWQEATVGDEGGYREWEVWYYATFAYTINWTYTQYVYNWNWPEYHQGPEYSGMSRIGDFNTTQQLNDVTEADGYASQWFMNIGQQDYGLFFYSQSQTYCIEAL